MRLHGQEDSDLVPAVDADEPPVILERAEVFHADDGRVEQLKSMVLRGSGMHGEPDVLCTRVDDGVDQGSYLHQVYDTAMVNDKMMVLTSEAICIRYMTLL